MSLTIGSLCSGYGGLDMAVEQVFGARTVWHCQYEPPAKGKKPKPLAQQAPSKILAAHWPGVPNHGDLTRVDWATVEPVDIIAAGYPCQPDSMAGKGLSQDDERWIWPDIARAVGVLRPRYVVLENVQGHFVRGFRTVLGSLASLGYDARWTLVRASDVGAPHRRERMFVIASDASDERHEWGGIAWGRRPGSADSNGNAPHADRAGSQGREPAAGRHLPDRGATANTARDEGRLSDGDDGTTPDAASDGRQWRAEATTHRRQDRDGSRTEPARPLWGQYEPAIRRWERVLGRVAPAPTETGPKGGQRLSPRFVEWMMGLPAGWVTDVPISRNEQLKALGNGVVPQQAAAALTVLLRAVAASLDGSAA